MAAEVVNLPSAHPSRTERLEDHLRDVVALSFPMYTYKELKRLLRCEYHRFVDELRQERTWSEITLLTGMTRAGLNKLGDEIPPRVTHSVIRTTYDLILAGGPEGCTLSQLAAAFYERCPELDDGPSLKEAVQALIDSGEVGCEDARYTALRPAYIRDPDIAGSIEDTVRQVAAAVRIEDGDGAAQMDRVRLRLPRDHSVARRCMVAMREAIVDVAVQFESTHASESDELLTVVLAGAPGLE